MVPPGLDRSQAFLTERFIHRAPQPEHHDRGATAYGEADAPAEFVNLLAGEDRQDD